MFGLVSANHLWVSDSIVCKIFRLWSQEKWYIHCHFWTFRDHNQRKLKRAESNEKCESPDCPNEFLPHSGIQARDPEVPWHLWDSGTTRGTAVIQSWTLYLLGVLLLFLLDRKVVPADGRQLRNSPQWEVIILSTYIFSLFQV